MTLFQDPGGRQEYVQVLLRGDPGDGHQPGAIEQGRQSGRGTMPAGLLTGDDADAVARFVAATAGR